MRKGTVITEDQIQWSEIGADAWKSARAAAAARAANGTPMTDEEIEFRARNAQDRDDLRSTCKGGNLSANCKVMNRSELLAETNSQLDRGLYGSGSKAGFKAFKTMRENGKNTPRQMTDKYNGKCGCCGTQITTGETISYDAQFRLTTCVTCNDKRS